MGFFDFLPWVGDDAPKPAPRKPSASPPPAPPQPQRTSSGRGPAAVSYPARASAPRTSSSRSTGGFSQPLVKRRAGNEQQEDDGGVWNWIKGRLGGDLKRPEYEPSQNTSGPQASLELGILNEVFSNPFGRTRWEQLQNEQKVKDQATALSALGNAPAAAAPASTVAAAAAPPPEESKPLGLGNVRYPHARTPESTVPPAQPGVRTGEPENVPGGASRYPTANPRTPGLSGPNNGKPVVLSDTMVQLLNSAGWKTPGVSGGGAFSKEGLDYSKAVDLKGYDYKLTNDEWTMLQNSVEGAQGYTRGKPLKTDQLPRISSKVTQAVPLTWDAYNALSDEQRKAVDFNTLLVEARQKDIGLQNPGVVPGEYNEKVKRIFGEGGGSGRPAPNTVNLLDKIGLEAKGQDLDEFLSLDRAITWDELQKFKFSEGEVVGLVSEMQGGNKVRGVPKSQTGVLESNFGEARSLQNLGRIETSAIDKAGAYIKGLMEDPNTKLWDFSSTVNAGLTGQRPDISQIPFGYGLPGERTGDDETKEKTYQLAYEYLTNKANTNLDAFWAELNNLDFTDEDTQDLFQAIDRRSRSEDTGVADEFTRTGAELRQFAGLEG